MEAPFVDHNHGEDFYFYRITYPTKYVNYSGSDTGMSGAGLQSAIVYFVSRKLLLLCGRAGTRIVSQRADGVGREARGGRVSPHG